MNKPVNRIFVILITCALFVGAFTNSTFAQPNSENHIESVDQISQDALNVEYVGQIGGASHAIALQGDYAYIGVGSRLIVLDINDPVAPFTVGEIQFYFGIINDVTIVGDYAYVVDYGIGAENTTGLRVVNIADPTHLVEVGFCDSPGFGSGVAVSGNYAYVADGSAGLRVVNIADPTHPTEVGIYDTPGYAYKVAVVGNHAYVADSDYGLRVINITDPAHPTEVGFYDTEGYSYELVVSGSYAYVADGYAGLRVVNITDPAHPVEVSFYDTPGYAVGVAVSGDFAYVDDNYEYGLRVVNIADPIHPVEVGYYDPPGSSHAADLVISGAYAYVVTGMAGLRVLNITDPAHIIDISFYCTLGYVTDVVIAGSYAYITDYSSLQVANISDPAHPVIIGSYNTPGSSWGVSIAGSYAYVADYKAGLRVVGISDPFHPVEVGFFDTQGLAVDVAISGGYAYVADVENGLRVINITDPAHPTEVGFFDTPGNASGAAVSGNYAYVADGEYGLRVINIVDPSHPTEVGFYDTPGSATDVTIMGSYAYVTDRYAGLRVVNITDPANPVEAGFIDTPHSAISVTISSSVAYVADFFSGVRIIDIADPSHPTEVGFYDTPGYSRGVAISGGFTYVADYIGGLFILRFSPLLADTGFRTFPDGYQFANRDIGTKISDFTIPDMIRMFGYEAVCTLPEGFPCIFNTQTILWLSEYVKIMMEGGHCYGMAMTSVRFFEGIDTHPSDALVFDLNMDDNVSIFWNNESFGTTVRRNIAYFHVTQYPEPNKTTIHEAFTDTPIQAFDKLAFSMGNTIGPPMIIVMKQGLKAHAVTPYAISSPAIDVYDVWVYDNNHPFTSTNPEDSLRYITINTSADTWSFDRGGEIWSGDKDSHNLAALDTPMNSSQLCCPWCTCSKDAVSTLSLILNGGGHLLITDSSGKRIGYVNDQYIEEILSGYGFIPIIDEEHEPIYNLPLTETYTILLDGQTLTETSSASLAQFGPGYAITVDDLTVNPTTQDKISISNDGSQITYQASQAQEPNFTLAVDSLSANYGLEIRGADIFAGEKITLTADTFTGELTLDGSQASGGEYTLRIRMVSVNGEDYFYSIEISILASDTHTLYFGDWDGTGTITLEIDNGSDGTIDETVELENQVLTTFLPVVLLRR